MGGLKLTFSIKNNFSSISQDVKHKNHISHSFILFFEEILLQLIL